MNDQEMANKVKADLAGPLAEICKVMDQATLAGLMVNFNIARDETNRNQAKVTVSKPL